MDLVAGKSAVARVFVSYTGPAPSITGVSARLRVRSKGSDGVGIALNGPIDLPQTEPRRERTDGTLNFRLLPEWTQAGGVTLEARVVIPAGFQDGDASNDVLATTFRFQAAPQLRIAYVPICPGVRGGDESKICDAPELDEVGLGRTLRRLYPVADDGVELYRLLGLGWRTSNPMAALKDLDRFRVTLRRLYLIGVLLSVSADQGYPDQLLGIVAPTEAIVRLNVGGASDPPWTDTTTDWNKARTGWVLNLSQVGAEFMPHVAKNLAHEVAHNHGLRHPREPTPGCEDSHVDADGNRARIGALGFDMAAGVVVPAARYDVMAYCSPEETWISPDSYRALWAALRGTVPGTGGSDSRGMGSFARAAAAPMAEVAVDVAVAGRTWAVVSGRVTRAGEASLDPVFAVQARGDHAAGSGTGPYCVRVIAGGSGQRPTCFDLGFLDPATGQSLDEQGFAVALPIPVDADRLSLEHMGREIASVHASRDGPSQLTIDAGPEASVWSEPRDVSWSGPEGREPLASAVFYSTNDGESWLPLAFDPDVTGVRVDPATAPAGTPLRIRVLASDGVRTSSAELGPVVLRRGTSSSSPVDPAPLPVLAIVLVAGGALLLVAVWSIRRQRRPRLAATPGVAAAAAPTDPPPADRPPGA